MSLSAEETVFGVLSGNGPVASFVGLAPDGKVNVHETRIPIDASMPAIAYLRAGTAYNPTIHSAASAIQQVTVEIWCEAKTATKARQLKKLVEAIPTLEWTKQDCAAGYDDLTDAFAQILTVVVKELP